MSARSCLILPTRSRERRLQELSFRGLDARDHGAREECGSRLLLVGLGQVATVL